MNEMERIVKIKKEIENLKVQPTKESPYVVDGKTYYWACGGYVLVQENLDKE